MLLLELFLFALPNVDEFTIKRAAEGDEEAKARLLEFYEKKVYNIALKFLRNSDDAFDAAQDSLLKIYKNVGSFRGDSAFSTWVYRLTVNTCLDMLKKKERTELPIDEAAEAEGGSEPERELFNTETGRAIVKAINSLSDEHRMVIVLCDLEGFSYDEIASALGISVGTVKSRIFRARERLKIKLSGVLLA